MESIEITQARAVVRPREPALGLALEAARARLFNPTSTEFLQDPYGTYRLLREHEPLSFDARTRVWTVTRYRDAQALLRDPRFGRNPVPGIEMLHGKGAAEEPVFRNFLQSLLMLNDPDHGRLRVLVNRSFNAQRVSALKPAVLRIAHELIDRMPASGEVELMQHFARALPVLVICELLGIPEHDRQRFIDDPVSGDRLLRPVPMSRAELDEENRKFRELRDYFAALCGRKREEPQEDLISDLALAEGEGKLSEGELLAMIWLIFFAGHETTVNQIGNALLALHRHPSELGLLRAHPELLPQATDELLRYDSSVQASSRHVLEDVDFLGQRLRAGERIYCALGSANRDPDVYADPDQLDLTRSGIKPVAFGGGIHYCLGAQLARLEGQVALDALLSRLPDLSLPELDRPDWNPNVILRGLRTLPARYSRKVPARAGSEPAARPNQPVGQAGRCPFH